MHLPLWLINDIQAQCTWYTVTVTDSDSSDEVTWQLIDDNGVQWLNGGAPYDEDVCLPDGCYTLVMYDLAGNGWEDEDWIIEDWIGEFDFDTNLSNGFQGYDTLDLGDNGCVDNPPGGGGGCSPGTDEYTFTVTPGTDPLDISWEFTVGGSVIDQGIAPYSGTLCLSDGCYFISLFDNEADGWEGATYTLADELGTTIATGTLTGGSTEDQLVNIGGQDCTGVDPDGGGTSGEGCGTQQPTSDCSIAPCICDPYTFNISASGWGSINDIPGPGSVSNPSYGSSNNAPWGGSDWGCLLAGELNSSWMMFTVATDGVLAFTFGANGTQYGYYDWAMWPYSETACDNIANNTLPPARCTWNAVSYGGTGLASTIPPGGNAGNYGPPLNVLAGEQYIICLSNWSYVNASVVLDFTGTADIDCNLILPIELLDLEATQLGTQVAVDWHTLTETNNDYFLVQRSIDLVNWMNIATVDGAGTSTNVIKYQTLDKSPKRGWNYYRLKQYDFNGTYAISDKVSAFVELKPLLNVYPNPATDQCIVKYQNNGNAQLQILDNSGKVVFHREGSELFPLNLDVGQLANGVYFIHVLDAQSSSQQKLIIQRD